MVSFKQCEELFVENGLEYSEKLHEKLCIYYEFLIEYNKKVNLTAITECEEVWVKHFLDSISVCTSKAIQGRYQYYSS